MPRPARRQPALDGEAGVSGGGPRLPGTIVLNGRVGVGLVQHGPQPLLLVQRDEQLGHGRRGLRAGGPLAQLAADLLDLVDARVRGGRHVAVLGAGAALQGRGVSVLDRVISFYMIRLDIFLI